MITAAGNRFRIALVVGLIALPSRPVTASVVFSAFTTTDVESGLLAGGTSVGNPACTNNLFQSPTQVRSTVMCDNITARDRFGNVVGKITADGMAAADALGLHAQASMSLDNAFASAAPQNITTAEVILEDTLSVPGPPFSGSAVYAFDFEGSFALGLPFLQGNAFVRSAADVNVMDGIDSRNVGTVFPSPIEGNEPGVHPFHQVFFAPPLAFNFGTGVSNAVSFDLTVFSSVGPLGDGNFSNLVNANFADTVRFAGIELFDANGNPVDASGLMSRDGIDYTGKSNPSVPEPAFFVPMALFLVMGLMRKAIPRSASRPRATGL